MLRPLVLATVALLLCGCSPDKGFGEAKDVTADEYRDARPLTVDAATLNRVCEGDLPVGLIVEGEEFTISDLGDPAEADKAFLRYWAQDQSRPSGRKDLSPLVDDGLALCD